MAEGLELLTGRAPKPHKGEAMTLEDGSRVAVIGAGPAGMAVVGAASAASQATRSATDTMTREPDR